MTGIDSRGYGIGTAFAVYGVVAVGGVVKRAFGR
jgi:hypothetical protein